MIEETELLKEFKSTLGYAIWSLEEAVKNAYKKGYEEGKASSSFNKNEVATAAYQRGFNDATFSGGNKSKA